jgi:hypothetical protein
MAAVWSARRLPEPWRTMTRHQRADWLVSKGYERVRGTRDDWWGPGGPGSGPYYIGLACALRYAIPAELWPPVAPCTPPPPTTRPEGER